MPEIRSHCGQRENEYRDKPAPPKTTDQGDQEGAAKADDKDAERIEDAAHHFDSVKASIESVFFELVEADRKGQHDCSNGEPNYDSGDGQRRRDRVNGVHWCFGRAQAAIDDRRRTVRNVANRHD